MLASVLVEPGQVEVQRRPVPQPARDDVLVEVSVVGVCGSDAHYFRHGRIGEYVVTAPIVLGHEAAGRIVAVGDDVPKSRIGERVSIEPQRPDPASSETRRGLYNLCPHMQFYATPPVDGALCEFVTIQSAFAHAVPDGMSDDSAALLEPLSVGIAAVRKAGIEAGAHVLIAGAGPVGLVTAAVARAFGATRIVMSDPDPARRARATEFGATETIDPTTDSVRELAVDSFIDASGAPRAVVDGMYAVRPAGTVVLVGMGADEVSLPLSLLQNRELVLQGVFRYANTWPLAIELATSGAVDLDSMVTARFGLEEVAKALEADRIPGNIKAVVDVRRGGQS